MSDVLLDRRRMMTFGGKLNVDILDWVKSDGYAYFIIPIEPEYRCINEYNINFAIRPIVNGGEFAFRNLIGFAGFDTNNISVATNVVAYLRVSGRSWGEIKNIYTAGSSAMSGYWRGLISGVTNFTLLGTRPQTVSRRIFVRLNNIVSFNIAELHAMVDCLIGDSVYIMKDKTSNTIYNEYFCGFHMYNNITMDDVYHYVPAQYNGICGLYDMVNDVFLEPIGGIVTGGYFE